jgi:hypothetical protein
MVIAAKLGLALGCLVVFVVAHRFVGRRDAPRARRGLLAAYAVSRLVLFGAVYGVAGLAPMSDVTVYYTEAQAVLAGQIPLVDIQTAWGPLFPYLASFPLLLVDSAAGIVALSVVFEAISLPLWLRVGDRTFGSAITTRALLAYVCCPLSLLNVPITGQNHVWLAAFGAAAVVTLMDRRSAWSGWWIGVSVVGVKFLSLLWAPVFWLIAPVRRRWIWGFSVPLAVVYGLLWWMGADLLAQIRFHAADNSSGNLPFLLGAVGVDAGVPAIRQLMNGVVVVGLGVVLVVAARTARIRTPRQAVLMMPLLLLVLLMLSKKSFASYSEAALFPLCLSFACLRWSKWTIGVAGIFTTAAAVEPTVWFRWMAASELAPVWTWAARGDALTAAAFVAIDVVLVGAYLMTAIVLWRQLLESDRLAPE